MRQVSQIPGEIAVGVLEPGGGVNLLEAEVGKTYAVRTIDTTDPNVDAFLRRLGCFSGQSVTVISRRRRGCIAVIKNGRYNLDAEIARAIFV